MAALVHNALTNSQVIPLRGRVAPARPGWLARANATLRLWQRRARERRELASIGERELRDMHVSSADVWNEVRQPFWRAGRQY